MSDNAILTDVSLGPVHLTVASLERSVAWYDRSLGLQSERVGPGSAELGDGSNSLVVLHENPDATAAGDHAGLYHYCILYPTRAELAMTLLRLQATDTLVRNIRDRGTHEALYLPDADNITIELAWDRPRAEWPADPYGHVPVSISAQSILDELPAGTTPSALAQSGLRVGHVHFTIGDIDAAVGFYRDRLGFDLRYHVGRAAFFSVGGYHHQVGANIYGGHGLAAQPEGTIGLDHWIVELGGEQEVAEARERFELHVPGSTRPVAGGFQAADPWGLNVHIVA